MPGAVRVAEEGFAWQGLMLCELQAVIEGDGFRREWRNGRPQLKNFQNFLRRFLVLLIRRNKVGLQVYLLVVRCILYECCAGRILDVSKG